MYGFGAREWADKCEKLEATIADLQTQLTQANDKAREYERQSEHVGVALAVEAEAHQALREKYQNLVAWYDKHNGTPCEQIRHQQEIERLQQRVVQLERREQFLMSSWRTQSQCLTTLQADHARVLELVQEANYELAALFPMPDNPTFEDAFVVCGNKNPADARCVLNAYEAIHQAASLPAQPVQGGAGTGLYDSPGHDIPGATCL